MKIPPDYPESPFTTYRMRRARVSVTADLLRAEAKREAPFVRAYRWKPRKRDIARLRRSTGDAIAYRTLARAWRHSGFKISMIRQLAGRAPATNSITRTRARDFAASVRTGDLFGGANEVTTMTTSTELTTAPTNYDGWLDVADEAKAQVIRGPLIKFADFNWTRGKEAEPIEKGTRFAAVGTATGNVRWAGGKPVEYRMREPGKPLAEREDLGDHDVTKWEPGPDGKPRDPWQATRFVYLIDPNTAEMFTFSTSSWGGKEAVILLGNAIARMKMAHPNAVPIVELQAAVMPTRFGKKSKPVFRIVSWRGVQDEVAMLAKDAAEADGVL